uniref:Uncharacterized protein n=1 Tax=viral metagenome TaxID=1070528 RepID=A0A6C0JWW6_9ZZZZ
MPSAQIDGIYIKDSTPLLGGSRFSNLNGLGLEVEIKYK